MFGPRRPRRHRRPRGTRHGEDDHWDPEIGALVPGCDSGYFGHGDLGEMPGPEFYPDPYTRRVNRGHNHDFTPRSRTRGPRGGNRAGGRSSNENITYGGGHTSARATANDGSSSYEVWNNGHLVASSRHPGMGGGRRIRVTGGVEINLGGGHFGGSGGPGGFGGRHHHRCRRHGCHSGRSRGGMGRMLGGGFGFLGSDGEDEFLDMFDDLDLEDSDSDYSDDFGGRGGSGAWGEDPFSGTGGSGRGGRRGAGGSRQGGGESGDDEGDEDGVDGGCTRGRLGVTTTNSCSMMQGVDGGDAERPRGSRRARLGF
ncbi:hypothetical protein A1O7_06792 [Cladophialophora yegresii CBS 114405]|uniref:Uncharacterized protein n=1 Tax=Cladophialophora yegresii CBS 114405 TaxID=1182544 RepID=W9VLR5_9EURO|nr:uncharacterized protein A1O7_06792 [Cladophialophora yegresii CBS 114405]EXJ56448.1 hypothetical protein A1O7_06792 [Cladophialophora yegresii CBS 114405]